MAEETARKQAEAQAELLSQKEVTGPLHLVAACRQHTAVRTDWSLAFHGGTSQAHSHPCRLCTSFISMLFAPQLCGNASSSLRQPSTDTFVTHG